MVWNEVDRIARSQLGLVSTGQLLGLGLSRRAIQCAVERRRLFPLRPAVWRVAGIPPSQDQAWLGAVLACRGDAVLSHRSAAAAWGLRHFDVPDRIDLLVPGESRVRLEGVRAHRTRSLPRHHRTVVRRIPITTGERTLVDVCSAIPLRPLGRSLDDALRRRIVHLPRLTRCLEEVPVSGRRASMPMRRLLAQRIPGYDPGGSAAELNVLEILKDAGISPLPVQQARIRVEGRTFRPDFLWPETKHIIEFDGGGGHDTESARHDDRERWRILQRAGFTIWAVTEFTSRNEIVAIGVVATTSPPV